jgi:hypothetical protein
MYPIGFFLGALIPTFLVSRLLLWATRSWQGGLRALSSSTSFMVSRDLYRRLGNRRWRRICWPASCRCVCASASGLVHGGYLAPLAPIASHDQDRFKLRDYPEPALLTPLALFAAPPLHVTGRKRRS